MLTPTFDLQGHRGARGLRPENTLPAFEAALDTGASSVETDLRLTRDGAVVLCHDDVFPPGGRRVSDLTLAEMRAYPFDRNPDPTGFPDQDPTITPAAGAFAYIQRLDPYTVPVLDDLFAFVAFCAGEDGRSAGKADGLRERAARLRFDLELKRAPFRPGHAGDDFDGDAPGALELEVVAAVRRAGLIERTTVRSFDHRSVRAVKQLEPRLRTAVLVFNTAPVDPTRVARDAGADVYCPDFEFLDERQVRQLHAAGVAVLPWTVNDADDWRRLLDWGVDGITTDYPDRLGALLRERGIPF
jgi:glycerophosphoryl diester phosphodiesterase